MSRLRMASPTPSYPAQKARAHVSVNGSSEWQLEAAYRRSCASSIGFICLGDHGRLPMATPSTFGQGTRLVGRSLTATPRASRRQFSSRATCHEVGDC